MVYYRGFKIVRKFANEFVVYDTANEVFASFDLMEKAETAINFYWD
jgi:hypothetical protein